MRLPLFSLVHAPLLGQPTQEPANVWLGQAVTPGVMAQLRGVKNRFRDTLLRSAYAAGSDPASTRDHLQLALRELFRQSRVETVGVWDVQSQCGRLPDVIALLNEVQTAFAIFEVQAAIPAGLVSRPPRIREWLLRNVRLKVALKDLSNSVIFDEFQVQAERVRSDLGLDYLIGVTPYLITDGDRTGGSYDYFSVSKGRIMLASTNEVYAYGKKAGRRFEVAVGSIAVSALLAAVNPKVGFHDETRGCLFDYNDDRKTIVQSLKKMVIEPSCLDLITPKYRDAAEAMVKALREYSGPSPAERPATAPIPEPVLL